MYGRIWVSQLTPTDDAPTPMVGFPTELTTPQFMGY